MAMPTTRFRLGIHFFVRMMELALLYGHFFAALHLSGTLLLEQLPTLHINAGLFALPLGIVLGWLTISYVIVFIYEMRAAGLPRIPEPGKGARALRWSLKLSLMCGIIVAVLTLVFYAVLTVKKVLATEISTTDDGYGWNLFAAFQGIFVSFVVLIQFSITHLDWLRRIRDYNLSNFATVPGMVQIANLLPPQIDHQDLKKSISRDAIARIVTIWVLGIAIVVLGVSYIHAFFPKLHTNTNLIAQLVVGAVAWLWISISATIFFVKSKKRELAIINGEYTTVGRSKLVTVYFAIVFMAGLVLALVCLSTSMYRIISTLYLGKQGALTFDVLLITWAPILFYAGLCMDVFLIHVRNTNQDQSVCCRLPITLTMGMEYSMVADGSLAYDVDF